MVSIILIVLFICQLVSFFLILILNSKLSKFKELEVRQEKIIREMDDAIGVYLMEMKEENNRLIQELTNAKQVHTVKEKVSQVIQQPGENVETLLFAQPEQKVERTLDDKEQAVQQKPFVPIAFATNAYNKQKEQRNTEGVSELAQSMKQNESTFLETDLSSEVVPFERQVIEMHQAGKNVEEIAKETQKGKTEIELLLKFHG